MDLRCTVTPTSIVRWNDFNHVAGDDLMLPEDEAIRLESQGSVIVHREKEIIEEDLL